MQFRVTPNCTIDFLVVLTMPCVKGKGGRPRKPPGSPKKLSKSQKIAKKLNHLDITRRIKQKSRNKQDSDASVKHLEQSLGGGTKSDIEKKCNIIRNFEEETAKLKHNKCQCCRMV